MDIQFQQPAFWVDSQQSLEEMQKFVRSHKHIGVDTESNSLYAYQEHVCLIQISADSRDYLIDALAPLDLAGLGEIFADSGIEKIFHAAEYDLLCLKRDYGFSFRNLFDTMQAARILGIERIGLSDMLEKRFAVSPGKSFQKANWGMRSLSEDMKLYARLDTHFLIPLRYQLEAELKEKNLISLAEEDFKRLCGVEPQENGQPFYASVSGYHLLSPQSLRVLDELARFRNEKARKMNRPLFKVIGSRALLAVAKAQPKNQQELERVEGLPKRLAGRYEKELLSAVKRGLSQPPLRIEDRKRPPQAYIDRLEALRNWRKSAAKKMGVQSDIVLPRDIMEQVAGRNPGDLSSLQKEMSEIPYRFEKFGKEIKSVLKKAGAL